MGSPACPGCDYVIAKYMYGRIAFDSMLASHIWLWNFVAGRLLLYLLIRLPLKYFEVVFNPAIRLGSRNSSFSQRALRHQINKFTPVLQGDVSSTRTDNSLFQFTRTAAVKKSAHDVSTQLVLLLVEDTIPDNLFATYRTSFGTERRRAYVS